jgi:hypothetical protein
MNVGMLWFDNDPRTALTAKVARAADYYRQKYGLVPDLCLVHPSMLAKAQSHLVQGSVQPAHVLPAPPAQVSEAEGLVLPAPVLQAQVSEVEGLVLSEVEGKAGKVVLRSDRLIQPGYLWIGKED